MATTYELATDAIRGVYDRRLSTPAILDESQFFPQGARFHANWRQIRDEALGVARDLGKVPRFHELMASQASISANDDRDWRMFILSAYGVPVSGHLARCPCLAALLAESPDVLSAAFSFLAPGKHIPEHRGPFRGILRFHLGLSVPVDDQGRTGTILRIDDVDHRIGDGDCLLWDDTYRHEVWNRSDDLRVALLLDVRRRGMPRALRILSRVLVGAIGLGVRWQLARGTQVQVG